MKDREPESGPAGSLLICIRVPKSGSASLMKGLAQSFSEARIFYFPNTLDPDSSVSPLQRLRFWRARYQNLFRRYRTFSLGAVSSHIRRHAKPGDLVMGGHVDFRTAKMEIARPLKMITLLREPLSRARSEYDYMRRAYSRKSRLNRFDSSVLHKAAGRYDFDSYLDYLWEHRHIYGNIACQYLGWNGEDDLAHFSAQNVFHCGVLERSSEFARGLSERLGRPFILPHENRESAVRPPLTTSQHAKLEQIYVRDLELHEWVGSRSL